MIKDVPPHTHDTHQDKDVVKVDLSQFVLFWNHFLIH